jgi:hypothetical protein
VADVRRWNCQNCQGTWALPSQLKANHFFPNEMVTGGLRRRLANRPKIYLAKMWGFKRTIGKEIKEQVTDRWGA